jgi:hypothetical protein
MWGAAEGMGQHVGATGMSGLWLLFIAGSRCWGPGRMLYGSRHCMQGSCPALFDDPCGVLHPVHAIHMLVL